MPQDKVARTHVRLWIDYCNSHFIPTFYKFLRATDPQEQEKLQHQFTAQLLFMDLHGLQAAGLGGPPYSLGRKLSLMDFSYYPFFERLVVSEYYRDFSFPRNCQRLKEWHQVLAEHPVAKATANSPEYFIEHYAKYIN